MPEGKREGRLAREGFLQEANLGGIREQIGVKQDSPMGLGGWHTPKTGLARAIKGLAWLFLKTLPYKGGLDI